MQKRLFQGLAISLLLVAPASPQDLNSIVGGSVGGFGAAPGAVCLGPCSGGTRTYQSADFAAVYAKLNNDELKNIKSLWAEMSRQLEANTAAIKKMTESNEKVQASIDEQVRLGKEMLHGMIVKRFDTMPAELLQNELFKQEMAKLKADILSEVDRKAQKAGDPPAAPAIKK